MEIDEKDAHVFRDALAHYKHFMGEQANRFRGMLQHADSEQRYEEAGRALKKYFPGEQVVLKVTT